jgi:hypothetical protein
MDDKYKKAIKSGLIGAVLIVLVRLIINLIFYWSLTRLTVQEFVNRSAGNTSHMPTNFSNIPPDVLITGLAIFFGGLLLFVAYMLAGAGAAYYIVPSVRGTGLGNVFVQNVICGAIAGAVAQVVSAPFTLLFVFLMNLYPAYGPPETKTNTLHWLGSQLITQYVDMLAVSIILGAIAALVCGFAAKALCRSQATT